MKVRVLVEVIDGKGRTVGRKMRSITVPPKRLKLIESFQGGGTIDFVMDEALTGASAPFQAPTHNPAEAAGFDPATASKGKLEEMLGLDIIESMEGVDRKQAPPPMAPRSQPMPGQMGMRPPPMSMSRRPGAVPTPGGGRGFGGL